MTCRGLKRLGTAASLICCLVAVTSATSMNSNKDPASAVRFDEYSKLVPDQLSYQGSLAHAGDSSAVTATLEMTFRLFDSETKGAELWSEIHPAVEVNNGLFQILLGSVTDFPTNLFDGNIRWLQTEVGTEVLIPRKPLVSTVYSHKAAKADYAATAELATDAQHAVYSDTADYSPSAAGWVESGENVYRITGKVGIGTSSPLTELDINGSVNATTYYGDGTHLTGLSEISDGDWTISGDDLYSAMSGNVGIGVMSPSEKLHVVGTSGNSGQMGTVLQGIFGRHGTSANEGYLGGNDYGAWGKHDGSSNYGYLGGNDYGVCGTSDSGTGICGISGTAVGGEGSAGVVGSSTNNIGIAGYSASSSIPAVAGFHSGDGPAVYGSCSGAYPCVKGLRNDDGIALAGFTDTGYGAYGHVSSVDGIGVVGTQTDHAWDDITSYSVFGLLKPGGLFGGRNGVVGFTTTEDGCAVMGIATQNTSQTWAGRFLSEGHGVYINVPIGHNGITVNGFKSAVVPTNQGSRLLYCEESTEVWFSDHGFGRLQKGSTVVEIDPLFAQTVDLDQPYHVFIQVYGDADVYVSGRTADHFKVHLRDGDPNVEFSYRLMAKRAGYEKMRLEHAAWADNDPHMYPEKRLPRSQIE